MGQNLIFYLSIRHRPFALFLSSKTESLRVLESSLLKAPFQTAFSFSSDSFLSFYLPSFFCVHFLFFLSWFTVPLSFISSLLLFLCSSGLFSDTSYLSHNDISFLQFFSQLPCHLSTKFLPSLLKWHLSRDQRDETALFPHVYCSTYFEVMPNRNNFHNLFFQSYPLKNTVRTFFAVIEPSQLLF